MTYQTIYSLAEEIEFWPKKPKCMPHSKDYGNLFVLIIYQCSLIFILRKLASDNDYFVLIGFIHAFAHIPFNNYVKSTGSVLSFVDMVVYNIDMFIYCVV